MRYTMSMSMSMFISPASSGAAVAWACRKLRMACVFASKLIVAAWSQRTPLARGGFRRCFGCWNSGRRARAAEPSWSIA